MHRSAPLLAPTRAIATCIAFAIGCGGGPAIDPKVAIELAEQPIIKDGIRSIFAIDLGAIAPAARPAALEGAVRTMRLRLQLAHLRGHVALDGERIVVDLAPNDAEALEQATDLLERKGRLEFHPVVAGAPIMTSLAERVKTDPDALAAEITAQPDLWGADPQVTDWALLAADREQDVSHDEGRKRGCWKPGPGDTVTCHVLGRTVIETYLATLAKQTPALAIPSDRMLAFELEPARGNQRARWRSYLVDATPAITGDSIARASVAPPNSDEPDVASIRVELDPAGAEAFAAVTEHHVNDKLAVILDDRVMSAPIIEAAIRGGQLTIAIGTAEDARQLAIVLTSGALPGRVTFDFRGRLIGGVVKTDEHAQAQPTPIAHEEHCGAVKATWRGEHDPSNNYDAYTSLTIEVAGRVQPWTQDLLEIATEARTPSLFSPDCQHVLLLTTREGPFHIIKTERMAAYLDGAKPDYVLSGEKDPKGITGTGVFRSGGWVSNREVAYTWGCCDPPVTTKFVLPP